MKQTIYTVHACRWGDTETHSYIVGVYTKKQAAVNAAITEEEYRGGKYMCAVLEWMMNEGRAGNHDVKPKVIKPLPPINTLKAHNAEAQWPASAGPLDLNVGHDNQEEMKW